MPLNKPSTLDAGLRHWAARLPNHVAYRFLGDGETESQAWTFARMDARARVIAAHLLTLSAPGQPVLLIYEAGLEPTAAFFGCLYAGLIAVPLAPPRPRQPLSALAAVAADAGASLVLTSAALLARYAAEPAVQHLRWLATDPLPDDDPAAQTWRPPATTPENIATLMYTSGSTSQPKGVVLTHKVLWGPTFRMSPIVALLGNVSSVAWMPIHHIAGLSLTLLILRLGKATEVRLPPEVVLAQPVRWLRAISRYHALHATAPNFLYQLCVDRIAPEERAGLDLKGWRFAGCTSEPIRAETLEQFTAAYAPYGFGARAFAPGYGLSEQAGVSGRRAQGAPRILAFDRAALGQNRVQPAAAGTAGAVRLVSNGAPSKEVTLRVVDPATETALAPGQVGEVWLRSVYQAAGYWQRPDETTESFGARLAGTGEGPFLRTGDLGFIYKGELYICGRLKDMLIIRGQNYHAQDIERAAAGSHPDVGVGAAAFGVPGPNGDEQLVLYQEVRPECAAPDVEAISAAIRRAVARETQLAVQAVVLVPAGALPRTSVGKVRRFLVREEYLRQQPAESSIAA